MRLTLALVAAAVAAGAFAAPAGAGTYDVWSCRLPNGKPAPVAGWRPVSLVALPPVNTCSTSGALWTEFQVGAIAAGGITGWQFDAPPGMTIASYELFRSARSGLGADGTIRPYGLYHDQPRFDPNVHLFEHCTPVPQGCRTMGDPIAVDPMDPDNRVARSGLRISHLILRMECGPPGGTGGCGSADPPGGLTIGRARIALSDENAPTLGNPTGELVTPSAVLDGAQGVSVSASDVGGGVERFAVLVDGASASAETLGDLHPTCRAPFVDLVPCPAATTRSFAFDTNSVPNGRHTIQIAALDAAGNQAVSAPVQVHIANGAVPNGVGASRRARLMAGFRERRQQSGRANVTVGYRRTRAIRGRLTGAGRKPIANARIDVMATNLRPGAKTRREAEVVTRADGRFRYVPSRGPSRRLRLRYHAFTLDPAPSATAEVKMNVRAGIRLDVRPRRTTSRGTIHFAGRLAGGPGRAGVQVALYAVGRRGRARVPVEVLNTDRTGRFRFSYRFARTFAPFTYRFRARLNSQASYPYAAGSSRIVTVRIVR
jgi:hypothetical protein